MSGLTEHLVLSRCVQILFTILSLYLNHLYKGLPPQWSEALKAHHLSAGVPPPVTSEDEKADLHQRRRSEVPPSPSSLHGAPTLPYKSTRSRRASEPAPRSNSPTILDGKHSFREEGGLTSWMWKPRWLALTARTLMVSKSQVCAPSEAPPSTASYLVPACPRWNFDQITGHYQHRTGRYTSLLPSSGN